MSDVEFDEETDEIASNPSGNNSSNTTAWTWPEKSRERYEEAYRKLCVWLRENKEDSKFSEDDIMDYFKDLSKIMKPTSLWALYSMLKLPLLYEKKIELSSLTRLKNLLRTLSNGYKPKKTKLLTASQIDKFLKEAPDKDYLLLKVSLIFGILGACNRHDLCKMKLNDFKDLNSALLVNIPAISPDKLEVGRSFVVSGYYYEICKKYMALRPPNTQRFFLSIRNGKCTQCPVGVNTFGTYAKKIATFLKLPQADQYTGHCFRKSSESLVGPGRFRNRKTTSELDPLKNSESEAIGQFEIDDSADCESSNSELNLIHDDFENSVEGCGKRCADELEQRNEQFHGKRIKVEVTDEPHSNDVGNSSDKRNENRNFHTGNASVSINFNGTTININICCNNRN